MILSDGSIQAAVWHAVDLEIDPLPMDQAFQPASLDVRMGKHLKRQIRTDKIRSMDNPPDFEETEGLRFVLQPGDFYLASTIESFKLGPRTSLKLEGKSSWGRCGLEVHSTAGWVDPGFTGELTLEMKVVGVDPVEVCHGDYIAQVCVFILDRPARLPYGHPDRASKYQGQTGPTGPRVNEVG